jgi:hypothetical protein
MEPSSNGRPQLNSQPNQTLSPKSTFDAVPSPMPP